MLPGMRTNIKKVIQKRQATKAFRRQYGLHPEREAAALSLDEINTANARIQRRKPSGKKSGKTNADIFLLTSKLNEMAQKSEANAQAAVIDSLTGLYNRRYFDNYLPQAIGRMKKGSVISVVFLDVDHFKKFNDDHGHDVGDSVLRHVAQRLKGAVRNTDMVARYGGEELIVVMKFNDVEEVQPALDRLEEEICALEITHNKTQYKIGNSLGVGVVDAGQVQSLGGQGLVNMADHNMYVAKRAGRGRMKVEYRVDIPAAALENDSPS